MGRLSKPEFVKVINNIQTVMRFQEEMDKVFYKYGCESPTFVDMIDSMLHVLNKMFDLEENSYYGSEIDYFIFELEFGANSRDLEGLEGLTSAEELYDYITKDKDEG